MKLIQQFRMKSQTDDCVLFRNRGIIASSSYSGKKIIFKSTSDGKTLDTIKTSCVSAFRYNTKVIHEDYLVFKDSGEYLLYNMEDKTTVSLKKGYYPNSIHKNDFLVFDFYEFGVSFKFYFFDVKSKVATEYVFNEGFILSPQTGGEYYMKVFNEKENKYPVFVKIQINKAGEILTTEKEVRCLNSLEETFKEHYALGREDYICYEGIVDNKVILSQVSYEDTLLKTIEFPVKGLLHPPLAKRVNL